MYGGCTLFALLMVIGFTSFSKSTGAQGAIGSMLLIFTFTCRRGPPTAPVPVETGTNWCGAAPRWTWSFARNSP